MIDCPICHVKNADDARFCAECGQRLGGGAANAQQANEAAPDASAKRPPVGTSRLHSPLLSGDFDDDSPPVEDAPGVDRLKKMAERQRPERPAAPETPYKNPFDPRNAQAQAQPPDSGSPSAGQRHRLRSPLLGGDDLEDELQPPQQLHDPAPRNSMHGVEDDEQAYSGGGLRSPLLGGPYGGPERRSAASDAKFGGAERRRGLHSPILGGEIHHEDQGPYYEPEEEAPLDEDDPSVLRSPLLSHARRPVADKPLVQSPPASNLQTPTRPPDSPQSMAPANKPQPNDSYTSLRRLSNATAASNQVALPPAPQSSAQSAPAAAGAPAAAQAPAVAEQAMRAQTSAPPNAPKPPERAGLSGTEPGAAPGAAPVEGYQFGIANSPAVVPPAFQNVQRAAPQSLGQPVTGWSPAAAAPQAPATTSGITVQAPEPVRQVAELSPAPPPPPTSGAAHKPEPQRNMAARFVGDADEYSDQQPLRSGSQFEQRQTSALPKLLGALLAGVLLVKLWVIISVISSDWRNYAFLVVDQLIGLIAIACLMVICFQHKK